MPARGWILGLLLAGCAPSLSTFQTAAVAPKGSYTAALALEGSVPAGALYDVIDAGKSVAAKATSGQVLTTDEKWQAFDAGMQLLLSPPAVGYHLRLAYVPVERIELSLRYAGSALRLGGRYQLVDRSSGPFDLTVGLGIARFTRGIPLSDFVPIVAVEDFTRWQIDVPMLIGTQRSWFRAWGGPRFLATFFDAALRLDLQAEQTVLASMAGSAYYVGAQGGFGVGYRWVFLAFELTITEMIGRARFDAPALAAEGRRLSLSGLVVYPALGLMGEW